jgi:branched-chain amino acid transport system ATP-binding protein
MLKVDRLHCTYSRVIQGLTDVSIDLNQGEVVGLLGPNGAGKTTTLRCITGEIHFMNGEIVQGSVEYKGADISRLLPYETASAGISLVPEDRKLFIDMTVDENLKMGAYLIKDKKTIKENFERVFDYFPLLRNFRRRLTGYLSGGEQQMLAIARALMSGPQVLLLDEPSTGLAPKVIANIYEIIGKIKKESGMSILLVEQNANMALRVCDRCFILEKGRVVLAGESALLKEDPKIRESYLGIS